MRFLPLIATMGLVLSGCSSTSSQGRTQAHRSLYKVETTFGDSVAGKTYSFVRNPPQDASSYDPHFRILERFLELEGMKSVEGTKMKPDFLVSFSADREDPPLGITIGVILPYTHTVRVVARQGGRIDWQIRAVGTSEEKELSRSLHRLLGAARHFFGQSTAGEQRVHLPDDDSAMMEILSREPVDAPSPDPSAMPPVEETK